MDIADTVTEMKEAKHPQVQIISRLIEGEYPNYEEIIPKKFITHIAVKRDEFLNQHWFLSLKEAQKLGKEWVEDYNEVRPHSALGGLSPNEFKKSYEEKMIQTRVA